MSKLWWVHLAALGLAACQGGDGRPSRATVEGSLAGAESKLFYQAAIGGTDTVVVVHGGPGLHSNYLFKAFAGILADRSVIAYDMRGRGRSETVADTGKLSLDADIADLERVRVGLGLESMTLIGHHWGAAVAANYAARFPGRVKRMVLVSPFMANRWFAYEFAHDTKDFRFYEAASRANEAGTTIQGALEYCRKYWDLYFAPAIVDSGFDRRRLAGPMCDVPAERLAAVDLVNRQFLRGLGKWTWRDTLGTVAVETLVIEGKGTAGGKRSAMRWAQYIPGARVIEVAGPMMFPWLDPPSFDPVIIGFLAGRAPDQSVRPEPFVPLPSAPADSTD